MKPQLQQDTGQGGGAELQAIRSRMEKRARLFSELNGFDFMKTDTDDTAETETLRVGFPVYVIDHIITLLEQGRDEQRIVEKGGLEI